MYQFTAFPSDCFDRHNTYSEDITHLKFDNDIDRKYDLLQFCKCA